MDTSGDRQRLAASAHAPLRPPRLEAARPGPSRPLRQRVAQAVEDAQGWLLRAQEPDGHWCGELEGDTILETEYVLLLHFLGRLEDPRVGKAARYVRRQQLAGGGWAIYPGGPPEVSSSVKAYLVLKLAGDAPEAPHMQRARRAILELGGIEACNSFTKIYLAVCGQYDWWRCPAVPPEMVLLPRWLYFNLYEISSWSRAIVVPLSVIWALRPVRPVAAAHAIDELRVSPARSGEARRPRPGRRRSPVSPASPASPAPGAAPHGAARFWRGFFRLLDRAVKTGERLRLTPLRRRALAQAEAWICERLEDSDGLGAIFPPIVNSIFALCCLGYDQDHPLVRAQLHELERLEIEDSGAPGRSGAASRSGAPGERHRRGDAAGPADQRSLRLQPCFSSVWDTALAMHALNDSGIDLGHPALQAARRWLLEREIRRTGDWSARAPGVPPGGWCFEYRNAFYPDCDDTAEVLTALAGVAGPATGGRDEPAVRRGIAWLLGMQNDDGGWGAFDRGCDKQVLTHVPFADHNALLDPSTADVTGRVVDTLRRWGLPAGAPELARATAYLLGQQEADGSWYGRWGCNYIYGTWLVLRALASTLPPADGADAAHATNPSDSAAGTWNQCRRRAAEWLLSHQNADGGWGESPRSYDDPAQKGIGPSTAAQTAWALMGLFAAGAGAGPGSGSDGGGAAAATVAAGQAIERGIEHLLHTQRGDGSWYDEPWTATGFPRVFYLRYHFYAVYFPLMALAEYRALRECREPRREISAVPSPHAYPLAVPAPAATVEGAVR
ncbi:MAG: squalene--hopene cyclase [Acidobacteria bacterium]|nr:squalene--hopene cyclase [Acidobacteriota bacterium]